MKECHSRPIWVFDSGLESRNVNETLAIVSVSAPRGSRNECSVSLGAFPAEKFSGFLVQQQVSSLGEIFVGARVDPDFGPLIVVGAGGVQVELYKDVAIRLAPIDEAEAREMINSTKVSNCSEASVVLRWEISRQLPEW
jgi:hypothetical protein